MFPGKKICVEIIAHNISLCFSGTGIAVLFLDQNSFVMKSIIIAASVLGATAAGVFWYMKNRHRADAALNDVKEAAKNAYNRMYKQGKKAARKTNAMVNESLA